MQQVVLRHGSTHPRVPRQAESSRGFKSRGAPPLLPPPLSWLLFTAPPAAPGEGMFPSGPGGRAKPSRTLTEEREERRVGRQVPLRLHAFTGAVAAFKGREASRSPISRYGREAA